jgi:hypothetical protein
MFAPRRLAPLLAVIVLAGPAPALAQGGAGDDQYQDPFAGDQEESRPAPSQERAQTPDSGEDPGLSEEPPTPAPSEPSEPSAGAGAGAAPESAAPPAAGSALPNTGLEVPGIALLGLGLLASGVGLRLRTADDTLF